jgi:L-asparaginase type I
MKKDSEGTLGPPDDPADFLKVAPELKDIIDFDFVPLMNKDSTNMNPQDWTKIAEAIYNRRNSEYKGFVIAHGTDTMHFSAAAVSFALGSQLDFPVVFTGAQTIPDVPHGDARVNLLRACKVCTTDLAEVVISFGDYVFRGCRAQKKDERRFDAFESPAFFPVGNITEEILLHPEARRRGNAESDIVFRGEFAKGVAQVSLIPGLEPDLLESILESEICSGLILQSFGAGNVPNEEPYSFGKVIKKGHEMNKPVIVTSQFPANATLHTSYAPGRAAVEAGAIPTGNMTSSCAAAKFRWVLAQFNQGVIEAKFRRSETIKVVNKMMQTIYVGEMDLPDSTTIRKRN